MITAILILAIIFTLLWMESVFHQKLPFDFLLIGSIVLWTIYLIFVVPGTHD